VRAGDERLEHAPHGDAERPGGDARELDRSGEKLLQSGQFNDKASTKRAASSLTKAVSGDRFVAQNPTLQPFPR
jgi:hypothetical protein